MPTPSLLQRLKERKLGQWVIAEKEIDHIEEPCRETETWG